MAKNNRKKQNDSLEEYIVVRDIEPWLQHNIPSRFCDAAFLRVVLFYVIKSPCKKGSFSRIDLEEQYQWKNPWYSERFKKLLNDVPQFAEKSFVPTEAQKNFKATWDATGFEDAFWGIPTAEFAVFTNAGESNKHLDLLHHIRNSFAHGRFTAKKIPRKDDYMILMEDVNEAGACYKVTARIAIKKSTLLKWIDIFECKDENAQNLQQELSKAGCKTNT